MIKDERKKTTLRMQCREKLNCIIRQSQQIKEQLEVPEKHQFIGWEYIGTLDKLQQELSALSALLQKVIKS